MLVAVAVQAVVHDDYDKMPAALGRLPRPRCSARVAVASYVSAAMPYAQPQSRKSLFASSVPGQKGRTFAASLGRADRRRRDRRCPPRIATVLSLTVAPVWGWVALVLGPVVGVVRAVDRRRG